MRPSKFHSNDMYTNTWNWTSEYFNNWIFLVLGSTKRKHHSQTATISTTVSGIGNLSNQSHTKNHIRIQNKVSMTITENRFQKIPNHKPENCQNTPTKITRAPSNVRVFHSFTVRTRCAFFRCDALLVVDARSLVSIITHTVFVIVCPKWNWFTPQLMNPNAPCQSIK